MAPNGEWDVFGANWGLGMPIAWFDVATISAIQADPREGESRIGRLILGWDGKEEDAWEVARVMLRALGWFVGESYEGKITFARLKMASVEDVASPTTIAPIPRVLRFEPAEGEGVDRLKATVGETPWDEGRQVTINLLSDQDTESPNSLRAGIHTETREVELDLRVLSGESDDAEEVALSYLSLVKMRSLGAPRLHIRATDPGSISTGDVLKIGDPGLQQSWFVDADGAKILVDGSPKWFGQVVGFRRNFGEGSIDLTLLMHQYHLNKFPRLRAPSAILASTVSTTTYTVDANAFLDPSGSDATGFTVNDYVELWTRDGKRRSGTAGAPDVQRITAIGTNTVTLDADFTTTGVVGDVLRYARLDTGVGNSQVDSPKIPGYVAYTFMSDAAGTLSPDNIDAHIYGFGII